MESNDELRDQVGASKEEGDGPGDGEGGDGEIKDPFVNFLIQNYRRVHGGGRGGDDEDDEDEETGRGRISSSSRVGLNDVVEPIMDASFQDDFDDIHSDYQWFIESGFTSDAAAANLDAGNFPTPLCIGVGTDFEFDANMAHIDMEDFQSQDILLRFPPLCASDLDLQPHQGETIASITGSILQQFHFESSMSPNSHSVEDEQNQSMDMSICKSENLFSPITDNQQQLPLSTFSTDSLDTRGVDNILATCMTNRNNYTIAFQGLELDESTTTSTYRTAPDTNLTSPASDMADNEMMTNWRQLKTSNGNNGNANGNHGSGNNYNKYSGGPKMMTTAAGDNNNGSNHGSSETSETNFGGIGMGSPCDPRSLLTQSCPNPWFWKKNSLVCNNNNPKVATAAFVKIFDIHASRPFSRMGGGNGGGGSGGSGQFKDNSSMTESNVHMVSGSGSGSGSGAGSKLDSTGNSTGSSGNHHRGGYIMEESWNNNRNPNPNPFRIRNKFKKARPTTTTQIAEVIKKCRSIEIQTSSIKIKPRPFAPSSGAIGSAAGMGSGPDNSGGHPMHKKTSPVFICFPSYTLPDLKFLHQNCEDDEQLMKCGGGPEVYLLPQKFRVPSRQTSSSGTSNNNNNGGGSTSNNNDYRRGGNSRGGGGGGSGRRPMSCNDIEDLRNRDLSHVRDWPSLNFLLPQEYQSILEVMKPLEKREQSDETEKERDASMVPNADEEEEDHHHNQNEEEEAQVKPTQLPVSAGGSGQPTENNEDKVILRKKQGRNGLHHHLGERGSMKRFSLNDTTSSPGRNRGFAEKFKRFSLQETLPEVCEITTEIAKNLEQLESLASHLGNDFSGSGARHQNHHHHQYNNNNHNNNNHHQHDPNLPTPTTDDCSSTDSWGHQQPNSSSSSQRHHNGSTNHHHHHHHHRRVPNNTPKQNSYIDFDNHFKTFDSGGGGGCDDGSGNGMKNVAHVIPMSNSPHSNHSNKHSNRLHIDMAEKQSLTDAIAAAVTQIQSSWTPASVNTNNTTTNNVILDNRHSGGGGGGGSGGKPLKSYPNLVIMSQSPGGRMVVDTLCPALYSFLSDGLCPYLETIFGRVPNTVWRVVEASIQYGPTAQTLNELVLRINSEELLAEGPMKLNAFVCGLLNLGNLGSWLTFLRTKERLLRTHYDPEAFLFLCNTSTRFLYDQMLVNMHLLAKLPFQLDIFHETKLLHQSMNPSSSFTSSKSNPTLPVLRKGSSTGIGSGNNKGSTSSGRPGSVSNVRKSTSADARIPKLQSKNSKYYANQLKKCQMKRSFSDERPKSVRTPTSTLPKSKTAQNIQNERQYSNSGVPKPMSYGGLARFPSKPKISSISADREKGMEPTKAQRPRSIEGDGSSINSETNNSSKDPDRFRRLQMQWELLSSDEARKTVSPGAGGPKDSAGLVGSKIPRPITSPIRNYYPGLPGGGTHGTGAASPGQGGPNVRPTSKR